MKSIKLLSTIFVLVAFSTAAFSQISADNDITATTTVVSSLTADQPTSLNFGTILSAGTPSIAADSSAAGYVRFTGGTDGAAVTIDVTYPSTLDPENSGTGDFTFTASNLGIAENTGLTPGAVTVTGVTTAYTHTISDNGTDTNFFVTIGGSLTPNGVSDDTYSGTINVQATYN